MEGANRGETDGVGVAKTDGEFAGDLDLRNFRVNYGDGASDDDVGASSAMESANDETTERGVTEGVAMSGAEAVDGGITDSVASEVIRSAPEMNAKQSITKAEAERLLRDVRQQTDVKMTEAKKQRKKLILIIVFAVILMAVLGVAVWFMGNEMRELTNK